jgi:hypothetical protein
VYRIRAQILIGSVMLALCLAIVIYVLATRPEYREPFGGKPHVSLFWFLMVLLFAWNALRLLLAWQKSFDRPKPPVRRFDDDEEDTGD